MLFQRLQKLGIDEQEYVVMKAINFLNQDIKNLENPIAVEEINKTYWYKTQAWIEMRYKFKMQNIDKNSLNQQLNQEQQRFRQLMLCLPEVRSIAGRLQELQLDKVPLMLKALLHTIKVSNPVQQQTVQPPPVQKIWKKFRENSIFSFERSLFIIFFFITELIPAPRPTNNSSATLKRKT